MRTTRPGLLLIPPAMVLQAVLASRVLATLALSSCGRHPHRLSSPRSCSATALAADRLVLVRMLPFCRVPPLSRWDLILPSLRPRPLSSSLNPSLVFSHRTIRYSILLPCAAPFPRDKPLPACHAPILPRSHSLHPAFCNIPASIGVRRCGQRASTAGHQVRKMRLLKVSEGCATGIYSDRGMDWMQREGEIGPGEEAG